MAVQINKDWRISGDGNNVILERRTVVEKGENAGAERWVADGYYPNVEQAYKGCATKRINIALDSEFWIVLKTQREILAEIKGMGGAA